MNDTPPRRRRLLDLATIALLLAGLDPGLGRAVPVPARAPSRALPPPPQRLPSLDPLPWVDAPPPPLPSFAHNPGKSLGRKRVKPPKRRAVHKRASTWREKRRAKP